MSETFHCGRALSRGKLGQHRLQLASTVLYFSTDSSKTIRCKALSACIHLEAEEHVECEAKHCKAKTTKSVLSVQAVSADFARFRDFLIQATRVSGLHGATRARHAIPNCIWQICKAHLNCSSSIVHPKLAIEILFNPFEFRHPENQF